MRRLLLAAALSVAAVAFAVPASAAIITDNFNAVGVGPFQANINISYDDSAPSNVFGGFSLTGASGEINGDNVTGLIGAGCTTLPYCSDGAVNYNNTLLAGQPPFDNSGWYLSTATLGNINFYSVGDTLEYAYQSAGSLGNPGVLITGTLTAVPEPLTLSVFGFGLLGIGLLKMRRNQKLLQKEGYSFGALVA